MIHCQSMFQSNKVSIKVSPIFGHGPGRKQNPGRLKQNSETWCQLNTRYVVVMPWRLYMYMYMDAMKVFRQELRI